MTPLEEAYIYTTDLQELDFRRHPIYYGNIKVKTGYMPLPDEKGTLGEDFIFLEANNQFLAFVICDGVGQSFYGHYAAQSIGRCLGKYLAKESVSISKARTDRDDKAIVTKMEAFLNDQTEPVSDIVRTREPPDDLKGFFLDAFNSKRKDGSQTVFAAGLVDFQKDIAVTFQLGNLGLVKAHSWDRAGWVLRPQDDRNRWTSNQGVLGEIAMKRIPLPFLLLVFTDGLQVGNTSFNQLWRRKFSEQSFRALKETQTDDIAFVLIRKDGNQRSRQSPG